MQLFMDSATKCHIYALTQSPSFGIRIFPVFTFDNDMM